MSLNHHPTYDTLMAYASGSLDVARSVVVASHLQYCSSCRERVRLLDHLGGSLLADLPPTAMSAGALERALAMLDEPEINDAELSHLDDDLPMMPDALRPYQLGPWRWIGPGMHWRSTNIASPDGTRVFLLRSKPGSRLPNHTHTGLEMTLILKGAYSHEGGRFCAGDLEEADGSVEHQPIVDAGDEDCVCLVAMNGNLKLLGVMGRLMQPFVRL